MIKGEPMNPFWGTTATILQVRLGSESTRVSDEIFGGEESNEAGITFGSMLRRVPARDVIIENCHFRNSYIGIRVQNVRGLTIRNCTFEDSKLNGIFLGDNCSEVIIESNKFYRIGSTTQSGPVGAAIRVESDSSIADPSRIIVTNSIFRCLNGDGVTIKGKRNHTLITNNMFDRVMHSGVVVRTSGTVVTNNSFYKVNQSNCKLSSGIINQGSGNRITDNYYSECKGNLRTIRTPKS